MSQNIDQLNIEIKAGADQATEAIRELRKSVAELKGEMSGLDREGAEVVDTLEEVAKSANLSADKMKSNSWWNNPITPASGFKANMTVTLIYWELKLTVNSTMVKRWKWMRVFCLIST